MVWNRPCSAASCARERIWLASPEEKGPFPEEGYHERVGLGEVGFPDPRRRAVAYTDVVDFHIAVAVSPGWPSRTSVMVEFASFYLEPMETPMSETNMTLIDLLQKHDEGDFLRAVTEGVLQTLMEHDVEGVIGAGRYERGDGRQTYRNGYRDRELKTRLGALNLRVPKLRQGSYFPGFLEPRRTSEKALVAVIQEAW